MTNIISLAHKQRFTEIKGELSQLGAREAVFIRIELLYFEALTIARSYGDDVQENGLLAALKDLQANEYAATSGKFAKALQREKTIRKFVNAFRTILTKGSRNLFLQPNAQL